MNQQEEFQYQYFPLRTSRSKHKNIIIYLSAGYIQANRKEVGWWKALSGIFVLPKLITSEKKFNSK